MVDRHHYFNFNNYSFVIACCLLIFQPVQLSAQNKLQLGPAFGLGICSMHDKSPDDKRLHIHTGIMGNYSISDNFKLQPTLLISTKGFGSDLYSADTRVNLSYIDAIVTLKFYPWKIFYVGFGPQIGYLLLADYSYRYDPSRGTSKSVDIRNITYDFDYGLNGSLGAQFKSGIGLELSVVYGMRPVFNQYSDEIVGYTPNNNYPMYIPDAAKGKNLVISVSFYALFAKQHNNN